MPNDFYIWDTIKKACETYADKTAIAYEEKCMTYGELFQSVQYFKKTLEHIGICSGMRVSIMHNNPQIFLFLLLGLWSLHCTVIPLDEETPDDELKHAFDSCDCHYALSGIFRESFVESDNLYIRCFKKTVLIKFDNPAVMFYTSGTTGESKCVVFDDEAMVSNILGLCSFVGINKDDIIYTPLKISLTAAMTTAVLPALAAGAALVLTPSKMPGSIWKVLRTYQVTVFFSVPYIYDMLTQTEVCSTEHTLRICLTCSAYMDPKIYSQFYKKTKCDIHSIYCSSEAGVISYVASNEMDKLMYTVGKPVKGVYIRVVDDNGEQLQVGKTGQIEVSGSNLAKGYYNRNDLTRMVFIRGWVKTGDLGYIDETGYIYLVGRTNEVLNISGHLVGIQEIEKVINQFVQVKDSLVYGLTDDHSHQRLACYIVLNNDENAFDENSFLRFCRLKMPAYKVPIKIQIVKELPQSRYGKKKRVF